MYKQKSGGLKSLLSFMLMGSLLSPSVAVLAVKGDGSDAPKPAGSASTQAPPAPSGDAPPPGWVGKDSGGNHSEVQPAPDAVPVSAPAPSTESPSSAVTDGDTPEVTPATDELSPRQCPLTDLRVYHTVLTTPALIEQLQPSDVAYLMARLRLFITEYDREVGSDDEKPEDRALVAWGRECVTNYYTNPARCSEFFPGATNFRLAELMDVQIGGTCRVAAIQAVVHDLFHKFNLPNLSFRDVQKLIQGKTDGGLSEEDLSVCPQDSGLLDEDGIVRILKNSPRIFGTKWEPALRRLMAAPVQICKYSDRFQNAEKFAEFIKTDKFAAMVPCSTCSWRNTGHAVVVISINSDERTATIEESGTRYDVPLEVFAQGYAKHNSFPVGEESYIPFIFMHIKCSPDGVPAGDLTELGRWEPLYLPLYKACWDAANSDGDLAGRLAALHDAHQKLSALPTDIRKTYPGFEQEWESLTRMCKETISQLEAITATPAAMMQPEPAPTEPA